ncbi:alpha/beta fold hydrolase [bacterium SCSIO 12741]|nr:alpha/beta fold hydrolase [bacterium SCSIO 12741]
MGMLDNWQGPAKYYAEHFQVYIIDARNHGHSPHSPEFTYELMADDLLNFVEEHDLDYFHLMGHSMGGKTVMKFAQNHPDYVDKLIVADIAPRAYPVHHQQILAGLNALDFEVIKSRGEAEKALASYVPELGVRQFLLKNMYWKEKGKLALRFNLDAITENIELIGEGIFDRIYEGPTLFIRGEKSKYVSEEDWKDIQLSFPQAELNTVKDAGHWLHAEKQAEFIQETTEFLLRD